MSADSNSYVLVISIGPVQDFIATARKCRDLWFGSWLLSELAKAAARAIYGRRGSELTVPGTSDPNTDLEENSDFAAGNKVVAVVREPRQAAIAAQEAVVRRLGQLMEAAFKRVRSALSSNSKAFDTTMAEKQLDDLIEFLWVAAPIDGGGYIAARAASEQLLADRKNTRIWYRPSWSGPRRKSTLDGARETVLPSTKEDGGEELERLIAAGALGKEEWLCGPGVVKRFGQKPTGRPASRRLHEFFSTSHFAALPLLVRIGRYLDDQARLIRWKDAIMQMVASMGVKSSAILAHDPIPEPYDGAVLFRGRLERLFRDTGKADLFQNSWKAIQDALQKVTGHSGEPQPYFAILVGDGDDIGNATKDLDRDAHRAFSDSLSSFARAARNIVEETNSGQLLYGGGDDLVAILPLHTALGAATQLHEEFGRLVGLNGKPQGLSAGLAIVHHLNPLDHSLAFARRLRDQAKGVTAKDALAIGLLKGSGSEYRTVGKWDQLAPSQETWTAALRAGTVSSSIRADLRALYQRCLYFSDVENTRVLVETALARIVGRKEPEASGASGPEPDVKADFRRAYDGYQGRDPILSALKELLALIAIGQLMAKAQAIAEG